MNYGVLGTTSSGGEADVKTQDKKQNDVAGLAPRHSDGSINVGALAQRGWFRAALVAAFVVLLVPAAAQAQQHIAIANSVHTSTVQVTVGKSVDVHTRPEPGRHLSGRSGSGRRQPLTDHALSILGKKIGTTRVTVYGQDKKPVGIFDVEVSYLRRPIPAPIPPQARKPPVRS